MQCTRHGADVNLAETTVPLSAPTDTSPESRLYGRRGERRVLDRLVADVRTGQSRVLVLCGDPGAGKTMLLEYLAGRASAAGCSVARAAGLQSHMGLAYGGLHQLCGSALTSAERLPGPQRDALGIAFGQAAGPPPDPFLVGLAVLNLLSAKAGKLPLVCLVDDGHWLDEASARALAFVARRLGVEPVALVFTAREPGPELTGLPTLEVGGLRDDDARALLAAALAGPLDEQVRDLFVAETEGNPRALLQLPRRFSAAELAGGFGLPGGGAPPSGWIEKSCRRQLADLPDRSRRLVQLAAADPSGDQSLVWRAAERLGIPLQAGTPAVEAGLVEFGRRVRFRHPLTRSAAYWSASLAERQQLHSALAEVTDSVGDQDRRAWHRALAAAGPDEEVAVELERSAGRAQARGGLAAAAAFLERAVTLAVDPARQAERMLAAAEASMRAGAFKKALDLLAMPQARTLDEFQHARADRMRGTVGLASGLNAEAPALLLKAAGQLESFDLDMARETYLTAWSAAVACGSLPGGEILPEICRAVRALPPPPGPPRPLDLLLDGLATLVTAGRAAAIPTLQRAARAHLGLSVGEALRWGSAAANAAVWDYPGMLEVSTRQVRLARQAGALGQLPSCLATLGVAVAWSGDFATTAALIQEANHAAAAIGTSVSPLAELRLRALQGNAAETAALIVHATELAAAGEGLAAIHADWAAAVLYNGLARYEDALAAALRVTSLAFEPWVSGWALPELVEAAARAGDYAVARDALKQLTEITRACGNNFALGIEARCRALLSEGDDADRLYSEAIDRLGRTELHPELARARLLYGEWLRRERRRADARAQLRTAHETLATIGMEAFAERARRELTATGETVRKRSVETATALTAQEALIARLARDGLTNPQIGSQLFLSARTVEWHLRKVFTKLDIGSRRELHAALAQSA